MFHYQELTRLPTHSYYHADGGGNITALVNDKQLVVARYEYDPFGNTLSKSGSLADANTYRFSSQEFHQNSGLWLYLFRAYDPNLQRFVNRDPIEELGGLNLYRFVGNNPIGGVDLWGLDDDEGDELDKAVERALKCGKKTNYVTQDQSHEASQKVLEVGLAVPKGFGEACMMFCPLGEGAAAANKLRSAEKAAANAAKLKNIKECVKVAKTLTEAVGSSEARAIVNDVLKGKRSLSDLKPEQAKAAAEFFKEIAKSTKGKLSEAASKFNQLRADFLEGKTTEVPGTLPDYIKRHSLPNQ